MLPRNGPSLGADAPADAHADGQVVERVLEHFRSRAQRAIERRRIFRYLTGALLVLSLAAGVLAWLVAPRDFETLGDALWWALVTLATVGYGDVVPETAWGRVIGSAIIVMGVTFLAMLTATVTSFLVAAEEDGRAAEAQVHRTAEIVETQELLVQVLARLEALEHKLDRERAGDPRA